MTDEPRNGDRTDRGREKAIDELEDRVEALEGWKLLAEYKATARDRRAQAAVRWAMGIAGGVVIAVASAFLSAGGHL